MEKDGEEPKSASNTNMFPLTTPHQQNTGLAKPTPTKLHTPTNSTKHSQQQATTRGHSKISEPTEKFTNYYKLKELQMKNLRFQMSA